MEPQEHRDEAVERLQRLDACAVSDALDRLGIAGAVLGIAPMTTAGRVVAGTVRTVQVAPRSDDAPRPHLATTAIESSGPGTVLVVANGARTDVSSWGGILSQAAQRRGVEGVIVDGACRDVDEARALAFPVFARAAVPVTARGRVVEEASDVPVRLGEVTVRPGDYAIADGSGVVVCPADRIEEALEIAEAIAAREAWMAEQVQAGRPVTDVMHDRSFERAHADAPEAR
jgi:regulator of RNase E activity RraA